VYVVLLLIAARSHAAGATPESPAVPRRPLPPDARPFHGYLQQHWALDEGLPQVGVADIVQGPDGFLWIGTQDGLARFDGREFRVFDVDNTPGLAGDNIARLAFDTDDVLWVGTRTGLSRYRDGRFDEIALDGKPFGTVTSLAASRNGMLVAGDAGVFQWNGTALTRLPATPRERVTLIAERPDGSHVIGLTGHVSVLDGARVRADLVVPLGEATVIKRYLAACGGEWLATTNGLLRITGDRLDAFGGLERRNVDALYCEAGRRLWVGAGNGLVRIQDGAIVETVDDAARLPHLVIQALHEDHEGGVWIGTLTGGVYRLAAPHYSRVGERDGLPFAETWGIATASDGGVWISGARGVAHLRDGVITPAVTPAQLPEPMVATLLEDGQRRLWIATRSGLVRMDLSTRRLERVLDEFVMALALSPAGDVWIGGATGLYSFHDGALQREGRDQGITRVRTILVSARTGLHVGTEQGAFTRRSSAPGAQEPFRRVDDGVFAGGRRVGSLHEDASGNLWIGYLGEGLARRASRDGSWRLWTERTGLLSNTVYGLATAADGQLWISTVKGVLRLAPTEIDRLPPLTAPLTVARRGPRSVDEGPTITGQVAVSISGREPGSSQGYCCNGGVSAAMLLSGDGTLWLATLAGALRLDASFTPPSRIAPTPLLLGVAHAGRVDPFVEGLPFVLPRGDRDLEITFAAPMFDKARFASFAYRLDGYDHEWKVAADRPVATYTNLPPGDYTFRVRVATADGVAGAREAAGRLYVTPYFHETRWFYGVLVPLLAVGAYVVYRWRVRQLEQRSIRLAQQVDARTAELQVANDELSKANQQLLELSHSDPLTRLRNRRYLADRIEHDIAQLARLRRQAATADRSMVFLLADVDHFKAINDADGHEAGDAVLVETAERLRRFARASDHLVRWGGEEFLIVACFTAPDAGAQIAPRLLDAVWSAPFVLPSGEVRHLTGSVGFATLPMGADSHLEQRMCDWEGTVALADHALYWVKAHGRNGWAGLVATPVLPADLGPQQIAHDIASHLERGEIQVVSSPTARP